MSHQIGESVFRGVLPEDIEWKPFPAFPPSARLAVVVGDPTDSGPYVISVKRPSGGQATGRPPLGASPRSRASLGLRSRLTPTSWSSNGSTIRAERLRMNV